jgi:hypothetical protein
MSSSAPGSLASTPPWISARWGPSKASTIARASAAYSIEVGLLPRAPHKAETTATSVSLSRKTSCTSCSAV